MADSTSNRGLLKYTSRDYDSIMEEFWKVVPTLTESWKPEADSDPGVVLGKWLASVADMLGVNLDWLASEIFAPSVTQRKNAEKIFSLIGYDLGWYTAARTECRFINTSSQAVTVDFGFNGANFCTLNAYTDITGESRVITYNILPLTNAYGDTESRASRKTISDTTDVFATSDVVTVAPGAAVTRVAIEGELRSYSVSVSQVKANNYSVTLPSQHIDTTAVWVKAKASQSASEFVETQWIQCTDPSEFITPEPRFAVTYDIYSNAQVTISNYLDQLENYDGNYLTIYWIDTSGVIGCVGEDVLSNLLFAKTQSHYDVDSNALVVSNLSNTTELPHTNTVTGKSPETAKEAYHNSRNYINTWDSLITLPDFQRFLNREPGVDTGVVIDCQKALEINMAIYNDKNLTDLQKSKQYITYYDFPAGDGSFDWSAALNLNFDPNDPNKHVFSTNFKRYTAMCFAIHNDFLNSSYGRGEISKAQITNTTNFQRYKPPTRFIDAVKRDYKPVQALSVDLQFGYARIFNFYVVGQIFTKNPVSRDVAKTILAEAREALSLYFAPSNRSFGVKPSISEITDVIQGADSRIHFFDPSSTTHDVINWKGCDPEYFNYISFCRYVDLGDNANNLRIAPSCIVQE